MAEGLTPIRRIVTGNDEAGRSKVVWDGPAPNAQQASLGAGRGHTDLWVWTDVPPPLSGPDDGNLGYDFPGPRNGGHLRVVQAQPQPEGYDPASDPDVIPPHAITGTPGGGRWDRGDKCLYKSGMHKTQTVDYGIVLAGERNLVLDDGVVTMRPGDIVIQVGAWHNWSNARLGCLMAFDMIGAAFVDGPVGLAQGNDPVIRPPADAKLPDGVKPARRIVTIDREPGKSSLVADGPAPDVRLDPARPGFASQRLWVTDSTPAKIVFETLHLPHSIEPPKRGSVCRVVTVLPDAGWQGKAGESDVRAWFAAMGSPGASAWEPGAPHPYMQKTATLDFCLVLDGEAVLVLDTAEVPVGAGEVVIQRGTRHAWANRSDRPATIAIASHDAS